MSLVVDRISTSFGPVRALDGVSPSSSTGSARRSGRCGVRPWSSA